MSGWKRVAWGLALVAAQVALADGVSDAYERGQRGGSVGTCCVALAFVVTFRLGGVGWARSFGMAFLPAVFGWFVWRDEGLSAGVRWFAVVLGVLQALGFVAVAVGGAFAVAHAGFGTTAEERLTVYRAGFTRRCTAQTPAPVCACVADAAFSSRDENELKRLGFGLQSGALETWLTTTRKQCATAPAGDGGLVVRPNRPEAKDETDPMGLRPWCTITSTPPGAKVFVNGEERGVAPLRTRVAAIEQNTLRLELDGFFPETHRVSPNTNEQTEWTMALRPASRLKVTTEPAGATVAINRKVVLKRTPGVTELLEPGEADVLVSLAGYQAQAKHMNLASRDETLEVALVAGAKVAVEVTPVGSDVEVDDVWVGVTPLDVYLPQPGKHTVVISRPGWSTLKRVLAKVKDNERITGQLVDIELVELKRKLAKTRAVYDKANQTLEKLQQLAERRAVVPAAVEKKLAEAEKAMQKAAAAQEAAETALSAAVERRR